MIEYECDWIWLNMANWKCKRENKVIIWCRSKRLVAEHEKKTKEREEQKKQLQEFKELQAKDALPPLIRGGRVVYPFWQLNEWMVLKNNSILFVEEGSLTARRKFLKQMCYLRTNFREVWERWKISHLHWRTMRRELIVDILFREVEQNPKRNSASYV